MTVKSTNSNPNSPFRSGYVAIVGVPNAGKSTLMNGLLGTKLSIVTAKPQTTRESILGILNEKNSQMIFLDTPGWIDPSDSLQYRMKRAINRSIYDDADVLLFVIDPSKPKDDQLKLGEAVLKTKKPVVVALNKIDLPDGSKFASQWKDDLKSFGNEETTVYCVSGKTKQGLGEIHKELQLKLPVNPPYFPTDQITDRWERFYVSELIREQLFQRLHEEVPHACAVVVEEFSEREGRKDFIRVCIFVETKGQQLILIGQNGREIKAISQNSRLEIERQIGRPVYLEIVVKIRKNWRKDQAFVKSLFENKA